LRDLINFVKQQTNKIQTKIKMIASRGTIDSVKQGLSTQELKLELYADEVIDEVPHYQEYGLASKPLAGCDAVTIFMGANRENGIVIATNDKNRPSDLEDGDVCLYTAQGAKILIKNADGKINITTDSEININCDTAKITAITKAEVTAPTINAIAETTAKIESPLVNVVSDEVNLGSGTVEKLLKGETFQTLFNAHTHLYAPGPGGPVPTAPPTAPSTPTELTENVKGS